jgi:hypothetical protein
MMRIHRNGRRATCASILAALCLMVGLGEPAMAGDKGTATLPLPMDGFACCNLHYEGDWISDGNYSSLPMLPAGTPIKVVSLGRHKAHVIINGKKFRLGHDYGRDQESLEYWIKKIVVTQDPGLTIATWPADVQGAIRTGKVVLGMTREQAIASLGYPLTSENPSLDAPIWRHWVSSFEEYQLNWDKNGKLADVTAVGTVRNQVMYTPGN